MADTIAIARIAELEARVETMEQALPILLRDTYHLSCTPEEWAIIERARSALSAGQKEATVSSSRSAPASRVAEVGELLAAIDKGRWAFEMLLHHRGNDVATLAWTETFLKEGFDIFRLSGQKGG